MSTLEVNTIKPISGSSTVTLGESGDTISVASGASLPGRVLGITQSLQDTRTTLSSQASYTFFSFNYDQQKANSKIVAFVRLHGWGAESGVTKFNFTYNGSSPQTGRISYQYNDQNYQKKVDGHYFFTGASSTGNKAVTVTYGAANGNNSRPFQIWNPNHNEDARTDHLVSYVTIMEYDL